MRMVNTTSSGMRLHEPCALCGNPAVRLLGTVAHCQNCAESFLDPIREKVRLKYGEVTITGKHPEWGYWLKCLVCDATWVGAQGDPCSWCIERDERLREDERASLLHPHWLERSEGNETYDSLSPIDQRIWDITRGQARGTHSAEVWARRLARAVASGLVTVEEARRAIKRYGPSRSL